MKNIEVKLFGRMREILAKDHVTIAIPTACSVRDLRQRLAEEYPQLMPLLHRSTFAINHDFAEDSTPIEEGAEIAIIPPVSGGLLEVRSLKFDVGNETNNPPVELPG